MIEKVARDNKSICVLCERCIQKGSAYIIEKFEDAWVWRNWSIHKECWNEYMYLSHWLLKEWSIPRPFKRLFGRDAPLRKIAPICDDDHTLQWLQWRDQWYDEAKEKNDA